MVLSRFGMFAVSRWAGEPSQKKSSSASFPAVARAGLWGGAGGGRASFPSWAAGVRNRTGGSTDVMFHTVLWPPIFFFPKPGHCIVAGMKGSRFWHQLSSPETFRLLAHVPAAVTFTCYHYPAAPPPKPTPVASSPPVQLVRTENATLRRWKCMGRLEGNACLIWWIKNPKILSMHELQGPE